MIDTYSLEKVCMQISRCCSRNALIDFIYKARQFELKDYCTTFWFEQGKISVSFIIHDYIQWNQGQLWFHDCIYSNELIIWKKRKIFEVLTFLQVFTAIYKSFSGFLRIRNPAKLSKRSFLTVLFQVWQKCRRKQRLGMDEGWCQESRTMVFEILLDSSLRTYLKNYIFSNSFIRKLVRPWKTVLE
jgi:hypothetical protein